MVTKEQLNEDIERRKIQRYIPVDESHRIYRSGACKKHGREQYYNDETEMIGCSLCHAEWDQREKRPLSSQKSRFTVHSTAQTGKF